MIVVTDNPDADRYEAHLDGTLAGILEYTEKRSRIALVHTEVARAFGGRGIAAELARFALADARRRGLRVIVLCPYVRAYLERHPEDRDVVVSPTHVDDPTE